MKGILFSFILLTIALTVVAIIAIQKSLVFFYGEKLAIETRINAMNNFYDSIVEDAPKALDIISGRAMSSAVSYVVTNGIGLDQADFRLKELILNGTLNETEEALMEDSTFTVWIKKMEEIGVLNGFKTNISIQEFEVKPYDSFNILIRSNLQINLSDEQGIASIKRNETVNQLVSIENFEDPLYPLNTWGWATNVIVKSPYWNNFTQKLNGDWDIENLKKDIESSYYHPSSDGASFLDRLEGKIEVQDKYRAQTDKTIGLEVFIDKEYFVSLGLDVTVEKTNVDHLYFSSESHTGKKVIGLENTTFRIDEELCGNKTHAEIYEVDEILI